MATFRRVLIAFFGLWIAGFVVFFLKIPDVPTHNKLHTDAIVVLTGGRDRISGALELLCEGYSTKLLISGVHPDETLDSLFRMPEVIELSCLHKLKKLKNHISLGYDAINTKGNARETLSWLKKNNFKDLRLVTAAYHIPRAVMEMESLFPRHRIIPHPIFPKDYNKWFFFKSSEVTTVLLLEYHKMIRAIIQKVLV